MVDYVRHVKINYSKANDLIEELLKFEYIHYLVEVPYDIYHMSTKNVINFLLIYDSINFSFWGDSKWTIDVNRKQLDGGGGIITLYFSFI